MVTRIKENNIFDVTVHMVVINTNDSRTCYS